MRTRLKCERPGDIEYTVSITATCKDWETLRDALRDKGTIWGWPVSNLIGQIDDVLAQARKIYWASEPPPEAAEERGAT